MTVDRSFSNGLSYDFLEHALEDDFEDIYFKVDKKTGMKAIIAIHSTKLGPALGGCRIIEYPNNQAAIYDALRLARGMSYKSALANLPIGGGKAVIIKPNHVYDRIAYLEGFARFIQELNGRYITALDSGSELDDMDIIVKHTPYVASLRKFQGDPAPFTALGVFSGIKAAVAFKLGKTDLSNITVAIQGLGHVGSLLAKQLHQAGAKLIIADIDINLAKKIALECQAQIVSPDLIHAVPCDVFAPCALGAIINDTTIKQLKASIIAGAANNQLAHSYHGELLHQKNILYAVDYVISAGGIICAASKYLHRLEEKITQHVQEIGNTLAEIFHISQQENRPTHEIAAIMVQKKLA